MMQKKNNSKMIGTLAHGYSSERTQRELSNEWQEDRVDVFQKSLILVLWTIVALALEGLTLIMQKLLSSKAQGHSFLKTI